MIHTYYLNGFYFALDVYSGAVHVVDSVVYALLQILQPPLSKDCPAQVLTHPQLQSLDKDAVTEAYDEIYSLYQDGLLFSRDSYGAFVKNLRPAPIKSMCLNVAHDCNLRCAYCFAAQGDFGHGRELMPFSVGKAAVDFLIRNSGSRRNLELDFFGGEPLMNLEVVRQVVGYARSMEVQYHKNFRFTITTNGLQLDEDAIIFINKEMSNVVLSLDGRKEVNDRLRLTASGKGCYEMIVPRYQALLRERAKGESDRQDYYVRGTFTAYNLDFTQDVLHMLSLGFPQLSIEPVVTPESEPYALKQSHLDRIFTEYETLTKALLEKKKRGEEVHFFHFMLDLNQGPCAIKRLRGCSCGNEYVAVTPKGELYPCHQFIGMEQWQMGTVFDEKPDENKKEEFANAHIYNKPECKNCWAKFYCSGGCNANNFQYCGSMHTPHPLSCEMERKRLECAIMMQVALQ